MISYEKLRKELKAQNITSYVVLQEKIIGQASWRKIQRNDNITMETLEKMCAVLQKQPADLIEWIPDGVQLDEDELREYEKHTKQ